MIGLERNADVVVMSSYAPLFGHVDAWQWTRT
ncbi:MAG: alpha-L-arabinofuranosidase C-terminal domain-containing protein [Verrucomicrobiota bacterium]